MSASASAAAFHAIVVIALLVGAHRASLHGREHVGSAAVASGPLTYVVPIKTIAVPTIAPAEKALPVERKVQPIEQPVGAMSSNAVATEVNGPVRVAAGDLTLLRKVKPNYPPLMEAARIKGVVVLDATIMRDGSIGEIKVLTASTPAFEQAAIAAVKQWRYAPPPYEALVTVTVNFTLT